jgi:hypothetical protein
MNELIELTNVDFSSVFISVFIILVGVKAIVSLFEWVINKLGLETKWMREKREEHELLLNTSNSLISLQEKHETDMKKSDEHDAEMRNDIKKLTDLFVDKQINDYRWEIINLADKIANGKTASKECLRHAIATYEKYEKIIAEHDLVNGEVEISIEVIRDNYQKRLTERF